MSDRHVDDKRAAQSPKRPTEPPKGPDPELIYVLEKGREPRVGKLFP
jgi:hypothetical protein